MLKMIKKLTNRDVIKKLVKEIKSAKNRQIEIITKIDSLIKTVNQNDLKVLKLESEINVKEDDIARSIRNLEILATYNKKGLNDIPRKNKIVVSLTSFPARINYVDKSLERLFLQTLKPDYVVLYLSEDQFPNKEEDLPYTLLDYKKFGLDIRFVKGDIKAYKKVLPALKDFCDDIIIIVDDDLIYDVDMVEALYRGYLEYPNAIIASRVHLPKFDEEGYILPYPKWQKQCAHDLYKPTHQWFFTGGAGTLIPPHIYDEEIFNEDVIKECAPHADDIWLNIHCARNNVPIVNIAKNHILTKVEESQCVQLFDINKSENDIQLDALRQHYSDDLKETMYKNK